MSFEGQKSLQLSEAAVAVTYQVGPVFDEMDITVGQEQDFVGDFQKGFIIVV